MHHGHRRTSRLHALLQPSTTVLHPVITQTLKPISFQPTPANAGRTRLGIYGTGFFRPKDFRKWASSVQIFLEKCFFDTFLKGLWFCFFDQIVFSRWWPWSTGWSHRRKYIMILGALIHYLLSELRTVTFSELFLGRGKRRSEDNRAIVESSLLFKSGCVLPTIVVIVSIREKHVLLWLRWFTLRRRSNTQRHSVKADYLTARDWTDAREFDRACLIQRRLEKFWTNLTVHVMRKVIFTSRSRLHARVWHDKDISVFRSRYRVFDIFIDYGFWHFKMESFHITSNRVTGRGIDEIK